MHGLFFLLSNEIVQEVRDFRNCTKSRQNFGVCHAERIIWVCYSAVTTFNRYFSRYHKWMDVKKSLVWLLLLTALGYMSLRVLFMPGYVSILRYGTDDITITRDQFNIPHVKAPNRNAAYYGVGYATAEDRLFQMHMKKMISQGRLS